MSPDDTFRLVPEGASNFAPEVDRLAGFLTAASVLMTGLVFVLIACFAVRYRRRSDDELPPATGHHGLFEVSMASGLLVVFMGMFLWGTRLYVEMKRPIAHALEINVVAKQWMWKVQHPGGQREINALHVPLGVPVKLTMTSQDVIHSFGLPAFRIKQDVLPDTYTTQWFTATKAGEFHLFCQEYCGTNHSAMIGTVVVMKPAAYAAWLAGVPADETPAAAGAKLFVSYGCLQCHGQVGPTLAGLYGRQVLLSDGSAVPADEGYIRRSIVDPGFQLVAGYAPVMPAYRNLLNEEQVDDLVAYIASLGSARADDPSRTPGSAGPATRPVNGIAPQQAAPIPPAVSPPPARRPPLGGPP